MFAIFRTIFEILLPRRDRIVRIDSYTLENLRVNPARHIAHNFEITTLMSYKTQAVEDCVRALKYDGTDHASLLLAEVLAEYLREEIADIRLYSNKPVALVPVPLHSSRITERGFNQVEKILEKLPDEFKNGVVSRIEPKTLVRTRATPQQTRLSRVERIKNVENAFATKSETLHDSHIILIDDVTTTGATLVAAAKPFGNVSISLIALSHA